MTPNGPASYNSRFSNCYGEEWLFEYDPHTREGVLSGSDVDWQKYRVFDGKVPELNLNEEERQWLRKAWRDLAEF